MNDSEADQYLIHTAEQMQELGRAAARGIKQGQVVFLCGALGSGKTTWVRGVLRGLGCTGPVKSPTYTLLEPYYLHNFNVYHFDWYRVNDASELEFLALRDYLDGSGVCVIEWPERGLELLPQPDCRIKFSFENNSRRLTVACNTELGESLCASMR